MTSQIVRQDTLRTLAFGAISGSYAAVGTPFQHPMRIVHFINNTDGDVFFSYDGVNDNIFVPAGGFVLYDYAANAEPNIYFQLASKTQVYCKQSTAPTTGDIWVGAVYGFGE